MIKYDDLSKPLKVLVVLGWIVITIYILLFTTGFIMGWMGV